MPDNVKKFQPKWVRFSSLKAGTPFTPAGGELGSGKVFLKEENGVCQQLGNAEGYGIFWPEDRVTVVNVNTNTVNKFLKEQGKKKL